MSVTVVITACLQVWIKFCSLPRLCLQIQLCSFASVDVIIETTQGAGAGRQLKESRKPERKAVSQTLLTNKAHGQGLS